MSHSTVISRGCSNNTDKNCTGSSCCNTDLCNDVTPTTTPSAPVKCFECTYRIQADGTHIGHKSCTVDSFDPLHAFVKTTMCDYGCAVSNNRTGFDFLDFFFLMYTQVKIGVVCFMREFRFRMTTPYFKSSQGCHLMVTSWPWGVECS